MPKEFTYAEAGVNRELRAKSKAALNRLEQTYRFSKYRKIIELPYGRIFPIGDRYLDLVIEGVGTKVLVAQLANKHDTIGIDGVAMAVNDVIRSGARPLAIVDNIHTQISEPHLVSEWMKGIVRGATEAECIVPGGEIGDVSEIIRGVVEGNGFDMVFACVGELSEEEMIRGDEIVPGDIVIGLRSSGVHSNGITLARKILFKQWGGKYEPHDIPDGFCRELIHEVLEPTRIYVKPLLSASEEYKVKGAVHITGDAYLKFNRLMKFSSRIGFEFNNIKPQPIFELIQKTASERRKQIQDLEMLKTFNMGWGFAVVVEKVDEDNIIEKFAKSNVEAENIGRVTNSEKIIVKYKGKNIELK